jgi:hypothetical protein
MNLEIGNFIIQVNLYALVVAVVILGIPIWIVYRPEKKIAGIFRDAMGVSQSDQMKFSQNQNNRQQWKRLRGSLDSLNQNSWKNAMQSAEKLLHQALNQLEPDAEGENKQIESLSQKNPKWLNVRSAVIIKNEALGDGLNKISYVQVNQAIDKFEKIFEEIGFI